MSNTIIYLLYDFILLRLSPADNHVNFGKLFLNVGAIEFFLNLGRYSRIEITSGSKSSC